MQYQKDGKFRQCGMALNVWDKEQGNTRPE